MRHPAYARDILALRMTGWEPHELHVFFGAGWPRPKPGVAMVGVASEWVPWSLDWSVAAGLPVYVHETCDTYMIEGWPAVLWLAAEIQMRALDVRLREGDGWSSIAWIGQTWRGEGVDPPWWTDEVADRQRARWDLYTRSPEYLARAWWLKAA